MKLSAINPDIALAEYLDCKIDVNTSATDKFAMRVYAQTEQPRDGLGTEYVKVVYNGLVTSATYPISIVSGNLALMIYSKTMPNGVAKNKRIAQICDDVIERINGKCIGGYYFETDITNIITPTTTSVTTGYAVLVLNVLWHTTNDKHNG